MKKKVLRRVSSTVMGALMFMCLPLSSFAVQEIDITGVDGYHVELADYDEDVIVTGNNEIGCVLTVQLDSDKAKTLIFRNLNIYSDDFAPVYLEGSGNVILELDGVNRLESADLAGLLMDQEVFLTIKDDNNTPGSLEAVGGSMNPGIGVGMGHASNIVIDGGTITAIGGIGGSGIGGGYYVPANITINGGTVTGIGGQGASGIGSVGAEAEVVINGGTVYAIGGESGAGIGGGSDVSGTSITISNDAIVYAAGGPVDTDQGFGEGAAIGGSGDWEDGNGNEVPVAGVDIIPDTSNLYTTGSVTTFAAGTTLEQMKANPGSGVTVHGTLPDPNEVKEPETTKDDTNKGTPKKEQPPKKEIPVYTERSCIADVNVAALIAASLKADPSAKEVNIEFGDNICLTPDIMKDLFADNRVAKNCMFSHKGKRYVLRINAVDTKSKAYADGFAALKEEPDGLAGFLQMAKLFEALGVKATELDQ